MCSIVFNRMFNDASTRWKIELQVRLSWYFFIDQCKQCFWTNSNFSKVNKVRVCANNLLSVRSMTKYGSIALFRQQQRRCDPYILLVELYTLGKSVWPVNGCFWVTIPAPVRFSVVSVAESRQLELAGGPHFLIGPPLNKAFMT